MGAKEFSKTTLKELRRIKRLRGVSAFCTRSGVNPKTFKEMVKNGSARADVVEKVEKTILELETTKVPTKETIETIVCTGYGITPEALRRQTRETGPNEARQVACMLMVEEGKLGKKAIAKHFEYADHTSVAWVIKTLRGRLEVETDLQERVRRIRQKVKAAA